MENITKLKNKFLIILLFIISLLLLFSCNKNKIKINYVLNGGINDKNNPTTYVVGSDEIILKDAYNKRCEFVGWYLDEEFNNKIEVLNDNITTDITLYAKFDGPRVFSYLKSTDPITLYGKDIIILYKEEDEKEAFNLAISLLSDIKEETKSYDEIKKTYEELVDKDEYINDQYMYIYIEANMQNDSYYYNLENEISDIIRRLENCFIDIDLAFGSSIYRNLYYEGYSDKEIDEYLKKLDPDLNKLKNDYQNEMDDAVTSYRTGEEDPITTIKSFVDAANNYAKLLDYDNYLDYTYQEIYNRDYTVDDTMVLKDYFLVYINPLITNLTKEFYKVISKVSNKEMKTIMSLLYDFYGYNLDPLDEYANMIGDDYLINYHKYFNSGNYFYSAIENDNTTGFVWSFDDGTPYMFLGKDYQSSTTFIHEFGHYNAMLTGGAYDESLDLMETQSQGNELLYYAYFAENYLNNENAKKLFLYNQLIDMLETIRSGILINEMEKVLYNTPVSMITEEYIIENWKDICDNMDADMYKEATDWLYTCLINYNGYYISYATSAIASIELYASSISNYEKAINSYKIIYGNNSGLSFSDILSKASLYDVFSENCYKLIDNIY